jgi:hypothetical protein
VRVAPAFFALLVSCSDLALPSPPERAHATVTIEPVGTLQRAPAVLRIRVTGVAGRSALADFRLFEGTLSSYYVHKLAAREVPSTLSAREIAVIVWADGRDIVVAPTSALSGGIISLATPELGVLAEVSIDASFVPWLERRWPPPDTPGASLAVFCGPAVADADEQAVVLEPSGQAADVRLGLDESGLFGETCLRVEPTSEGAIGVPSLPPSLVGTVGLEPKPLLNGLATVPALDCSNNEVPLGPACAAIEDDRIRLRAPEAASLWALEEPERRLAVVAPGASLVLGGIAPSSSFRVRGTAIDLGGARTTLDEILQSAPQREHLVLNEVLADPVGPEPASEWVEVVNAGTGSLDLAGYELRDTARGVALPSVDLDPGAFVLLVTAAFAADAALDVPPLSGTRIVRLPSLGQSGLANSGELLRLLDRDGHVVSTFPSIAAPAAGVSVARRSPDAPDDETASFGEHAPPGASPGAPNTLAPP